jgi:hypothetical protein
MKTIADSGVKPAVNTGTGTRTLVVPAAQRGIITNIHGSSVTGGAVTLNLGTVGGTLNLGSIPANNRIDILLADGVAVGDVDHDIILTVPGDCVCSLIGYFAAGLS